MQFHYAQHLDLGPRWPGPIRDRFCGALRKLRTIRREKYLVNARQLARAHSHDLNRARSVTHNRRCDIPHKKPRQRRAAVRTDENQIRLRLLGSVQDHPLCVALEHQGCRFYPSVAKFFRCPMDEVGRALPGLFCGLAHCPQMSVLQHVQHFHAGFRGPGPGRDFLDHGFARIGMINSGKYFHVRISLIRSPSTWTADHTFAVRKRKALPITETELKLIAAAAIMGLSSSPNTGYSTPAAIGTPTEL